MAKQRAKATTTRAVAKPAAAGIPAALAERMKKDAGKGVSTRQEDNLVPLIYILQKGSPQVNEREDVYIEGAEAGKIWLRNMPEPIADGDEGIIFQPCHFSTAWVEWMPDRGGFVARHDELPEDAERVVDSKNPNRAQFIRGNGNEVVETRYYSGLVYGHGPVPLPFVIPFSSTGHTSARELMFLINQKIVDGVKAPIWSCLYRLKTFWRKNNAGDWYSWKPSDIGWVDESQYELGKSLHEAFASGEKKAEAEAHADDDAKSSDAF